MLSSYSGDPIVAHISPGKGLVIHHESCRNIRGYQKNLINLWLLNGTTTLIPTLSLKLKWMINHQGALANLTAAINDANSSIQSMNTEEKMAVYIALLFALQLKTEFNWQM